MRPRQNWKANIIRGVVLMVTSVLISGCSVLPKPKPAPAVYRLSIPQGVVSQTIGPTKVVNIERPTTSKALSGMDIVLSPDGRRLTMASGAHWAQPVPALLQNVLIDILTANPNITGIIPKGNTRVPYRLNMDIRRFEAVFDNGETAPPLAMVQLNLYLTDTNTRTLVGMHSVNTNQRAGAVNVSSIVDAQDGATHEAMENISKWLTTKLNGSRLAVN